jgi:hypothetical protein
MTVKPKNIRTYQVLCFNWPYTHPFVIRPTLLRFSLASEATVVDFQIRRRKDKEICRGLVSDALPG